MHLDLGCIVQLGRTWWCVGIFSRNGLIWGRASGNETDSPSLEYHRGSDRDAGAVQAASRNAERAGVADTIQFSVESISASLTALEDMDAGVGWILTNPPYGIRMGESDDLRNLYARLGAALRTKRGWRAGILTADTALVRETRLPLVPRFNTRNGGIPVSFLVSEKPRKAETHPEIPGVGGGHQ